MALSGKVERKVSRARLSYVGEEPKSWQSKSGGTASRRARRDSAKETRVTRMSFGRNLENRKSYDKTNFWNLHLRSDADYAEGASLQRFAVWKTTLAFDRGPSQLCSSRLWRMADRERLCALFRPHLHSANARSDSDRPPRRMPRRTSRICNSDADYPHIWRICSK